MDYTITNNAIAETIGKLLPGDSPARILQLFLTNFITLGLQFAGVTAFFYLLWGGYQYVMSGSDKESVQKAVKAITNALIGLAIIFSIFAIIMIFELIFGISILEFTIPTIS